jgi:hypothetical protein
MDVISFLCISLGSSTVQLHESQGSRRSCACSEAGFSSQNGKRASEVYYRRAEFWCAFFVCLFVEVDSLQRVFLQKYFQFTVGSVRRVKRFTTGRKYSFKEVRKSQMMPDQVRKWLRQQSKDFYAAGFDALIKRWDKCINVGGGCVEK